MADYDVEALALTSPPIAAVKTQYRPAFTVRNNGLFDALGVGYFRIYRAGLLVFETEVYTPTIPPGAIREASGVDYFTPAEAGDYFAQGYVSTNKDQVEPNNNLAPSPFTVTEGPLPPTPTVPLHAAQHEEGGTDELSVDGLPGRLGEPQVPLNHASDHEPGGADTINVTGMSGLLAEAQTAKLHAASHKIGGADVLAVAELTGASNYELLAHKNAANGYPGLDNGALILSDRLAPAPVPGMNEYGLRFDRTWGPVLPTTSGTTLPTGIICIWNGLNPTPADWIIEPVGPALTPPYVYIRYAPAP